MIAANLMAARLTVLYGPSGVGKTSVLRAGVAQRLRREPEAVVVVASSWGDDPVAALLDAIDAAAARVGARSRDALEKLSRRLDSNVYLVLDQFEEYFLYHEGESGPGTLIDELPEALRRRGLRVNFLIGIREDSLAQLDAFKARIPGCSRTTLRLDRLDRVGGARPRSSARSSAYNRLAAPERAVGDRAGARRCGSRRGGCRSRRPRPRGRGGVDGRGRRRVESRRRTCSSSSSDCGRKRRAEEQTSCASRRCASSAEPRGSSRTTSSGRCPSCRSDEKDAAAAMYNHLVTPSGTKIAHDVEDLAGYAVVDEDEAGRVLRRLADQRIVRAGR